jgi:hypothetical protein
MYLYELMNVNGTMEPVETIQEWGRGDKRE